MNDDLRVAFIKAATWHGSLDEAEALLAAHPELASCDIHVAAIQGDDTAVRRFLALDPASATAKSEPYGGDALNYLGLSKYLRLDRTRTDAFVRAAAALLDAGADPNTGFWTRGKYPEYESALYGAAGVAHHPEVTRLLLERGADPNDVEVVYHSPETYDIDAMKLVVETGRLTPDSLSLMLIRKHDWHDYEGVKYLLEHGAVPNHERDRGFRPLHHAIARDNSLAIIELLLDHGADPLIPQDGKTAVARAARRGRRDLLEMFEKRGLSTSLPGVLGLVAACARNDTSAVQSIIEREPALVQELLVQGGQRIAEFAGTWNTNGVRQLLDLGVPVAALYEGDGYFGIAKDSTALHVAAWKGVTSTVSLLIERGAPVDARDGAGNTPLMLAIKACVDSYWTERRSPHTVDALLRAGASLSGVMYPSGYAEVDELLRRAGAGT